MVNTMSKYTEQLKDVRWKEKSLLILKRDNYTCCRCRVSGVKFSVHHFLYFPNTKLWEYPNDLLITLCDECHSKEDWSDGFISGYITSITAIGRIYRSEMKLIGDLNG